jgi:hypothetical protein
MDRQTGVWRSRLARSVRDAEVGGSSPLTPTRMAHHFLDEMSAIKVGFSYETKVWNAGASDISPRLCSGLPSDGRRSRFA